MGYLMAPGMRVNLLQGDAVFQITTQPLVVLSVVGKESTETTRLIKIEGNSLKHFCCSLIALRIVCIRPSDSKRQTGQAIGLRAKKG